MNTNTVLACRLLVLYGLATVTFAASVREAPPMIDRSYANVTVVQARSLGQPLRVEIEAFDTTYYLRLTPVSGILADDFKLYTTFRDAQGQLTVAESPPVIHDDFNVYQDTDMGTVLDVQGTRMEGILSPPLSLQAKNGDHEVVRFNDLQDVYSYMDYLEVPEGILLNTTGSKTQGPISVTVEMFVIVDSELASLLGSDAEVKRYLSIFWNAVQQRYTTLNDPYIKLIISDALVVRNPKDETYIASNLLNGDFFDGTKTLSSLGDWLFKHKQQLPQHDLAFLMTGKNMADMENGALQEGLAGIAWKGAACTVSQSERKSYNIGVGEDMGASYRGVLTAAHEVAHSLGSPHDGQGESAQCPWDDGYIMSYVTGSRNRLFFSPCSAAAMKNFLRGRDASCLKTQSSGVGISLSSQLPGHLYSLDKQCQMATGKAEAYASTKDSDDALCVELKCQYKGEGDNMEWTYTKSTGQPAAEGSPCRSGGRCTNGRCQ